MAEIPHQIARMQSCCDSHLLSQWWQLFPIGYVRAPTYPAERAYLNTSLRSALLFAIHRWSTPAFPRFVQHSFLLILETRYIFYLPKASRHPLPWVIINIMALIVRELPTHVS